MCHANIYINSLFYKLGLMHYADTNTSYFQNNEKLEIANFYEF